MNEILVSFLRLEFWTTENSTEKLYPFAKSFI
jgi:hypothetical protein